MYTPEKNSMHEARSSEAQEPTYEFKPLPTLNEIVQSGQHGKQHTHPLESVAGTEWHAEFTDLISALTAERKVLEEFRDSAPNSVAAAYVQCAIDMRIEIAAVTGIPF